MEAPLKRPAAKVANISSSSTIPSYRWNGNGCEMTDLYEGPVASRYTRNRCGADGHIVVVGVVHDGVGEQAPVPARKSAQKRFGGVEKWQPEICFSGGESGIGRTVYSHQGSAKCRNDAAIGV